MSKTTAVVAALAGIAGVLVLGRVGLLPASFTKHNDTPHRVESPLPEFSLAQMYEAFDDGVIKTSLNRPTPTAVAVPENGWVLVIDEKGLAWSVSYGSAKPVFFVDEMRMNVNDWESLQMNLREGRPIPSYVVNLKFAKPADAQKPTATTPTPQR